MAYDEVLAERLRERLGDRAGVAEKKMFGGVAFLTHGNMTVAVHRDDLLVRRFRNGTCRVTFREHTLEDGRKASRHVPFR